MKKIILLMSFVLLIAAAVIPLVSDIQFRYAKQLEKKYRWRRAKEAYFNTIKLAPFNSTYYAETGDFLLQQSKYLKNRIELLTQAETLYKCAVSLNPKWPEYYVNLAIIQSKSRQTKKAFGNFKKAIKVAPKDYRILSLAAYNAIALWNSINVEERQFMMDILRNVLLKAPWDSKFMYPQLWEYTKDFNLLREITPNSLEGNEYLYDFIIQDKMLCALYHKEQQSIVDYYREKEEPEKFAADKRDRQKKFDKLKQTAAMDWQGESVGGNIYEGGNMYWSGTIDKVIDIPEGAGGIAIEAMGEPADGVYPYMVLELDGEWIGETFVDSGKWKQYDFEVKNNSGTKVISVTFVNDGGNDETGEDRNLYIGKVEIIGNL